MILLFGLGAVVLAGVVLVLETRSASADAGRGIGLPNVTTNQFTHPWQGGWLTDVGTAWCIQSGAREPRAVGNVQIGDVPALRGVGQQDRWALSYALWMHSKTTDPVTGAALATVVRGLSGDEWADVNVPAMSVSDPAVKARAVELYREAQDRAHWVNGPWRVDIGLEWQQGTTWISTIRFTNAAGQPIAGHRVDILADNVVAAEQPGVVRNATTDSNGTVVTTWHQFDVSRDLVVLAGAEAPGYYSVWAGPAYPSGSVAQNVVTGNGTRFDDGTRARVPRGLGRVRKSTTNPAYQSGEGAVFEVRSPGGAVSFGMVTVRADGFSEALDLDPGTYEMIEKRAPDGVRIDTAVHEFSIVAGQMTTVEVIDEVDADASLELLKLDVATGEPVGGAIVGIRRDRDGDDLYEEDLGLFTLGTEPTVVDALVAGRYEVTEVSPPDGYLIDPIGIRYVELRWNETATITFADHRIPSIVTHSQAVGEDGLDAALSGDIVVGFGASVRDVVTIEGLAPDEEATLEVGLYGPFLMQDALPPVCGEENLVWSESRTINGSGNHPSSAFTPSIPGVYGYVATLDLPGVGVYAGQCGESAEAVTVTSPSIVTTAQVASPDPGTSVADLIVVSGLGGQSEATLTTSLYGPFGDDRELSDACATGDLGDPVGTVTEKLTGSGPHMTEQVELPTQDGVYTFIAVLEVDGLDPISHECGVESETFRVERPVGDSGGGSPGEPEAKVLSRSVKALPRTGIPVGAYLVAGFTLIVVGAATVHWSRRPTRTTGDVPPG